MNARAQLIKDDSSSFVLFTPEEDLLSLISGDCQTVSIDPAPKNFALRIEKRLTTGEIQVIYMDRMDFSNHGDASESTGSTTVDPRMLIAITTHLDSLEPWMKQSQIVAVERQLAKNYKATRIFQHLITYFMLRLPSYEGRCALIDLSPKLKGKLLEAPKGLNYTGLKKWGVEKAMEILEQRGDEWSLQKLKSRKGKSVTKADDLADTIIQMEAWFKMMRA